MHDNKQQAYNFLVGSYYGSGNVKCEKNVYGWIAINKGGTGVRVNNIFLKPFPPGFPDLSGESFSFVDPERKLYNEDFVIEFDAAGTAPWVQLIQVYCANPR